MTNLEKAKDLYHKVGMEESTLSALCEMADWKDTQFAKKVISALGCDTCKAIQCSGCIYYGIKKKLI